MNMRSYMRLTAAAAVMTFSSVNPAFATQTDVVLNLEGNPGCSALAINSILEIRDTTPPLPGVLKTVTGPDGQQIKYTVSIDGTAIASWHVSFPLTSSKPVNLVILKALGGGSRVFHFGSAGVASDDIEQAAGRLAQVSFCYGLSQVAGGTPQPLASCSSLALGGLNETGITCPADGTKARVLISLDPGSPHWNVKLCTCNTTFTKCDPNAAAGQTNACPKSTLATVPIHIEGVQDPHSLVCTTIGGQRLCFNR